nr:hypothetical protein CFP56_22007 [Quercus suber]
MPCTARSAHHSRSANVEDRSVMPRTPCYAVYKLRSHLTMQDLDMPSPRFHTAIFVETNARGAGTGTKHHVTGDITTGMRYESKPYPSADDAGTLHSKDLLGHADSLLYPQAFDDVLRTLSAPPKQKAFNIATMRTEPVKSWEPLTFYQAGEPRRPLVKCTEWTEQEAIPALQREGLIVQER